MHGLHLNDLKSIWEYSYDNTDLNSNAIKAILKFSSLADRAEWMSPYMDVTKANKLILSAINKSDELTNISNKITECKDVKLNIDRFDFWMGVGKISSAILLCCSAIAFIACYFTAGPREIYVSIAAIALSTMTGIITIGAHYQKQSWESKLADLDAEIQSVEVVGAVLT